MNSNVVVTIGRQYGCGGRDIGKAVAEKLGVKYFDNELITMAAEKNGVNEEYYASIDEKPKQKLVSMFGFQPNLGYFMPIYDNVVQNDTLFVSQASIIKEVAKQPCVIVGRCADYILKDEQNLVSVFLCAELECRKKRIKEKYNVEKIKNIDKALIKADKQRSSYYNTYTDKDWGASTSYDICINTSRLTIDQVAEVIIEYIKRIDKK